VVECPALAAHDQDVSRAEDDGSGHVVPGRAAQEEDGCVSETGCVSCVGEWTESGGTYEMDTRGREGSSLVFQIWTPRLSVRIRILLTRRDPHAP
jgi:hypothetical protein